MLSPTKSAGSGQQDEPAFPTPTVAFTTPPGTPFAGFVPYSGYSYPSYSMAPPPTLPGYPTQFYHQMTPPAPNARDPELIKEIVQEVVSIIKSRTLIGENKCPPPTNYIIPKASTSSIFPALPSPDPKSHLLSTRPLPLGHAHPVVPEIFP